MDNTAKELMNENMKRTYEYKNRGLELKLKTMELLYEQVELLAKKSRNCESDELYEIQKIMAMLGQAIIPD